MSNYYGFARSNYFRVKDLAKFKAAVEHCNVEIVHRSDNHKAEHAPDEPVALLAQGDGGWDSYWCDDEGNDHDFDISDIVAEHLCDDEVAVFMNIGYEKLCYLSGQAVAINNKKKAVVINLQDIYDLPEVQALGKNITRAEY